MEDKYVEEIKRHFDVVAENLRDDIRLVAEGHQVLNRHIEQLGIGQDKVITRLDSIDARTLVLEKGQEKLEKGQEKLEKRQEKLEKELRKTRLVLGEKIDMVLVKVENHDGRIERLEGRMLG